MKPNINETSVSFSLIYRLTLYPHRKKLVVLSNFLYFEVVADSIYRNVKSHFQTHQTIPREEYFPEAVITTITIPLRDPHSFLPISFLQPSPLYLYLLLLLHISFSFNWNFAACCTSLSARTTSLTTDLHRKYLLAFH